MFADAQNVAVLAAAGSRKTQAVIDAAIESEGRTAVVTFTTENRVQIQRRIEAVCGVVPNRIHILGWYQFLITHGAKPFQTAMTGRPFFLRGLNFQGEPRRGIGRDDLRYYVDGRRDLYARNLADFVVQVDHHSGGLVMSRLKRAFETILIDEVQDLAGWDLELLDLLFSADIRVGVVGDPRQHTYSTTRSNKNSAYRGAGLANWLDERSHVQKAPRTESYRCNQAICDFADELFPDYPRTVSVGVPETGHDGIFTISADDVADYVAHHDPKVLRHSVKADTHGLSAINIGVSKGSTYDRVLIFTTGPMRQYLEDRDLSALRAPESLYVAVTRARFSVAFVV